MSQFQNIYATPQYHDMKMQLMVFGGGNYICCSKHFQKGPVRETSGHAVKRFDLRASSSLPFCVYTRGLSLGISFSFQMAKVYFNMSFFTSFFPGSAHKLTSLESVDVNFICLLEFFFLHSAFFLQRYEGVWQTFPTPSLFFSLLPKMSNPKHSLFFHFLYHINNFLLLFK
jgi:hypothetical protein